jgi:(1->4)-alpha-D-glucan 1-alpha-D-glucosylmutase
MRIPTATYRIQFHSGFTFEDARKLVPYLHRLGISDLYASPLFTARQGSTHGYDVADLERLNPALGGEDGFERLVDELHKHNMGLLLDIVPNHMAANWENPWWHSVLEYGPESPYETYFDIAWGSSIRASDPRLFLPVLGAPFGEVLENSELSIVWENGRYAVRYYDHRFPVTPATYREILLFRLESLRGLAGLDASSLQALIREAEACPPVSFDAQNAMLQASFRAGEALKLSIAAFRAKFPAAAARLDENLRWFNGSKDDPATFGPLESLLEKQPYRLGHWRLASAQINYRRFFDISDLAGLRVEEPRVFEASHREILRLVDARAVTGLRIDHIDGLYDPKGYLQLLQQRLRENTGEDQFVVVEKILGPGETLPSDWPVAGTTGYDFSSLANGLFVDPKGLAFLDRNYADFTQTEHAFGEVVRQGKELVIHELFTGELENLTQWLAQIAAVDRHARDIPARELREALAQVTAAMPVYRSYTRDFKVNETDRRYIEQALTSARERTSRQLGGRAAFSFLRKVLLLEELPPRPEHRELRLRFVRRWQQFSGPAMAKGLEDTAFFRHTRLISLNAVGGTAEEIEQPLDVVAFHEHNAVQRKRWPHALNTTTTHDTKRSGDVSARINVVSETPFAWARAYRRWRRLNKPLRRIIGDREVPNANEEILLYQTLIGAWPWDPMELEEFRRRIKQFMWKALREAKLTTSWLRPDETYEQAVLDFIDDILEPARSPDFLMDFDRFHQKIAFAGAWNALSQSVLKITSPGVPDFYQGDELWDFSLTDPDNRRPVNFDLRRRLLEQFTTYPGKSYISDLLENWRDGRIKLFVTACLLQHRQQAKALYEKGEYIPVYATGPHAQNVVAYLRKNGADWSLTAVPRLVIGLAHAKFPLGKKAWGRTVLRLPAGAPTRWRNVLTGETVHTNISVLQGGCQLGLRDVLVNFPVTLLVND